jgi:hypothetical protein
MHDSKGSFSTWSEVAVGSRVGVGWGDAVGSDVLVKAGVGEGAAALRGAHAVNKMMIISETRAMDFIISLFSDKVMPRCTSY